eukprot:TRINITY_DN7506_c0_g1_i1.p1 TRINITY_DN7506_c0_g1~~TRINITY_DN7506_c0_g1_i1.p1  ORF type:complete len:642 (-),score=20.71 TRINITY_DN7506_c0_g1_i1:2-1927(-)
MARNPLSSGDVRGHNTRRHSDAVSLAGVWQTGYGRPPSTRTSPCSSVGNSRRTSIEPLFAIATDGPRAHPNLYPQGGIRRSSSLQPVRRTSNPAPVVPQSEKRPPAQSPASPRWSPQGWRPWRGQSTIMHAVHDTKWVPPPTAPMQPDVVLLPHMSIPYGVKACGPTRWLFKQTATLQIVLGSLSALVGIALLAIFIIVLCPHKLPKLSAPPLTSERACISNAECLPIPTCAADWCINRALAFKYPQINESDPNCLAQRSCRSASLATSCQCRRSLCVVENSCPDPPVARWLALAGGILLLFVGSASLLLAQQLTLSFDDAELTCVRIDSRPLLACCVTPRLQAVPYENLGGITVQGRTGLHSDRAAYRVELTLRRGGIATTIFTGMPAFVTQQADLWEEFLQTRRGLAPSRTPPLTPRRFSPPVVGLQMHPPSVEASVNTVLSAPLVAPAMADTATETLPVLQRSETSSTSSSSCSCSQCRSRTPSPVQAASPVNPLVSLGLTNPEEITSKPTIEDTTASRQAEPSPAPETSVADAIAAAELRAISAANRRRPTPPHMLAPGVRYPILVAQFPPPSSTPVGSRVPTPTPVLPLATEAIMIGSNEVFNIIVDCVAEVPRVRALPAPEAGADTVDSPDQPCP